MSNSFPLRLARKGSDAISVDRGSRLPDPVSERAGRVPCDHHVMTDRPMEVLGGYRVLDVSSHGAVPIAGSVLADWGADVIKVEDPEHGEIIRGGTAWGVPPPEGGSSHLYHIFNHGKRCAAINLKHERGREALLRVAETADVFLTSFLPGVRRRLGIDVGDIRARRPAIVYGRNTGRGTKGPFAELGGFDATSFWSRAGLATATSTPDQELPTAMPAPAFGDSQTGFALAAGVVAALLAPRADRRGHGRRHVAAEHRHVGDADRDRDLDDAGRRRAAPSSARLGHAAGELVPHEGRSARPRVHGPAALLAVVLRRSRSTGVEGRPAVGHPRGSGGERAVLRDAHGRPLRRADPRRVEGGPRRPTRPVRPRAEGR